MNTYMIPYAYENFYSPTQLLDNSLESTITNPTKVIKIEPPININHFEFANHNTSPVLTLLTPPSSPPQTVASPPVPQSSVPQTVPFHLPVDINNVLHHHQTVSEPVSPIPQVETHFGFVTNWQSQHHSTTDASVEEYIDFHTQIIDDILKSAADEIFEESESQSSLSTPSQADYSTTDDELLSSGGSSPLQHFSIENLNDISSGSSSPVSTKKLTRPYRRGVEDRKIRKKEQNKNAATRYRQKKKLEMESILVEEQELNKRHEELKSHLAERKREAKYLKALIREFYSKKQ